MSAIQPPVQPQSNKKPRTISLFSFYSV